MPFFNLHDSQQGPLATGSRRKKKGIHLGFLIASLIQSDMARGIFSFAHSYERRIRCIFPGLFAMLVVVTAAAYSDEDISRR